VKRKIFKAVYILTAFVAVAFIFYFSIRNTLLTSKIDKKIQTFQEKNIIIKYDQAGFTGLSSVYITDFSIGENDKPAILQWDSLNISLSFIKMITGSIKAKSVYADKIHIFILKNDSIRNYDFLFINDSSSVEKENDSKKADYRKILSSVIGKIKDISPDDILINSIYIGYNLSGKYSAVNIPELLFDGDFFSFKIIRRDINNDLKSMRVAGRVISSDNLILSKIICDRGFVFPFIDRNYDFFSGFDTAVFSINFNEEEEYIQFSGYGWLKGLFVRNFRIAPDTVSFPPLYSNFIVNTGGRYVELDSSSTFIINKLAVNTYFKYLRDTTSKVCLKVRTGDIEADNLFSSLPSGLFTTISGIQTKGNVNFHLDFEADISYPDSLILDAEFSRKGFRIERYGAVNFSAINEPFMHSVYERGQLFRTFEVGPENPYFVPFQSVSKHLINAILCTEDGAFFNHRGFIPEAFRESAATNIKEKRFARGGSTLSMQLVKNVFLNRNKNIARKAEEMIIVWLIENNGLVSKERMFEVYLNIIEWGPGLYGAGEACDFYFGKKPAALSVEEAIYLASIIPMPKYYKSKFQHDGNLKPDALNYIRLIRNKMVSKGMITPADTLIQSLNFRPEFIKSLIVLPDSVQSPEVSN